MGSVFGNSEIWQLTADSVIAEEKPRLMLFYYRSANSHPIFSLIGSLNKILERFRDFHLGYRNPRFRGRIEKRKKMFARLGL